MRNEFVLTKLTTKQGNTYYYYYAYDEQGKRRRYATGETTKTRARQHCLDLAKQGKLIQEKVRKVSFKDFSEPYFTWGKCPIITETITRGGRYSRTFCENNRKCIDKHLKFPSQL